MSPALTPLDAWIARRIGAPAGRPVSAQALEAYQLDALRKTLAHATTNSPFHATRLKGHVLETLADLPDLPFTTQEHLREQGQAMLCVGQDQVARIMTLHSSGTTGPAKRVFFSDQDLEGTLDFFHHGMTTLVRPGDKVLILLPGTTPDSTGDLLARALGRFQAQGRVHGLAEDTGKALQAAHDLDADCLVGFPVQILAMARLDEMTNAPATRLRPKSVLFCSDYSPRAAIAALERIWGCEVFTHWGASETGLGGGVECGAHDGCHLRHDLVLEIVDPVGHTPLARGHWGEVVVTTLNRRAMPLIRYRTGDAGRLVPGACACGTIVPRLDRVRGRLDSARTLANGRALRLCDLDEALLDLDRVMDFKAGLVEDKGKDRLNINLAVLPGLNDGPAASALAALRALPVLTDTEQGPGPIIDIREEAWAGKPYFAAKRTMRDERGP